jgi:transcriptional regulator with XRE-family HTH domain
MARKQTAPKEGVGRRIETLRKEKGLSQDELGEKLCYSRSAINMLERGDRQIKDKDIIKFADFFNTTSDYLLGISGNRFPVEDERSPKLTKILGEVERALTPIVDTFDDTSEYADIVIEGIGLAVQKALERGNKVTKMQSTFSAEDGSIDLVLMMLFIADGQIRWKDNMAL